MLRVTVAAAEQVANAIAAELEFAGLHVSGLISVAGLREAIFDEAQALASQLDAVWAMLDGSDVLVVEAEQGLLGRELLAACDRRGIRIVPLVETDEARRAAHSLGLTRTASSASPWGVVAAITGESMGAAPMPPVRAVMDAPQVAPAERPVRWGEDAGPGDDARPVLNGMTGVQLGEGLDYGTSDTSGAGDTTARGQVLTVWGPGGSPGRSTIAIELAYELARGGRSVLLVDADTQGASLALALGIADEGPGFAAACRQAGLGVLDAEEIQRISVPLAHPEGSLRLLTGINRPARWPELTEERVGAALRACRDWADYVVVDVAAPLERDEEIVSDLDGLRRHAAGFGALRAADVVVAVASIEPVAMARFVRGHAELRAVVGPTPIAVVANRLRPGALGVDARGQVRATLARFAGTQTVSFVPLDPRSVDAAMLAAAPIGVIAPKSPMVAAVRRLAGEILAATGRAAVAQRLAGHPDQGDAELSHGAPSTMQPAVRPRRRRAALRHTGAGVAAT